MLTAKGFSKSQEEITTRELVRLQRRNRQTERVLSQRQYEIDQLKQTLLQRNRPQSINQKTEFAREYQYLTGKIRDLDRKIKIIIEEVSIKEESTRKMAQVQQRIAALSSEFIKFQRNKFDNLQKNLCTFCSQKEAMLSRLEANVETLRRFSLNIEQSIYKILNRSDEINILKRQLSIINHSIHNLQVQEMTYDSPKLDSFNTELNNVQNLLSFIEKEFHIKFLQVQSTNQSLKRALEHSKQCITENENKIIELQRLQGIMESKILLKHQRKDNTSQRSLNDIEKKQFKEAKIQMQNEPSVQSDDQGEFENDWQWNTNKRHHINYLQKSQNNSSVGNFLSGQQNSEDEIIDESNPKLDRLSQIISLNNQQTPLCCSVDQTGFLKFKDNGSYIFDKDGYMFELSQTDIEQALHRKLIVLG